MVAPPTQLAAAHSVAAVEVFRFFAEIPTPIKSDKNQPIEDVMAELRNLKMLVDEGVLTEEEFQQKKRQLLQLD